MIEIRLQACLDRVERIEGEIDREACNGTSLSKLVGLVNCQRRANLPTTI